MREFTRLVAATLTRVDHTESTNNRGRLCRERAVGMTSLSAHRSTHGKTRTDSSRLAAHVDEAERHNHNNTNQHTSNHDTRHIVLEEARGAITITDTTAIIHARTKRNAVAIQAGLVKRLVIRKEAETTLVNDPEPERLASTIQAAGSVTITDTTPVENRIALGNAKAVEACRVAVLVDRVAADTTRIRCPTRVGNTVATSTSLAKRVVKGILAHATPVNEEATVGNIAAIRARLVKHRRFGLCHRVEAVAASIDLASAVGPARAISTGLVELGVAERKAVTTLVVAEVGERHLVAAKARLAVTAAYATHIIL